jgi:phage shock protein C
VGRTTLDLDDVSDDELESLYFEDDTEEESSLLNIQTISGLSLILAGIMYLLTEIGVWADPALLGLNAALPWLIGVFVILVGFGVLTWRPSRSSDEEERTTKKAVDANTGETKVVEGPKKAHKNRLTRSRTDKKFLGVCGGIAEYLNLDPTLVRIAFVIGTIATSGPPFVLAYFGLAFAIPKEEPLSPEERLSIIRDEVEK